MSLRILEVTAMTIKAKDSGADGDIFKSTIADVERHIIVSALERCAGNQSMAARQLGTTKRMLAYRVRKYGIDREQFVKNTHHKKGDPTQDR
jgi:transcriptional regulator with GAF, ATPase, and Fis domain